MSEDPSEIELMAYVDGQLDPGRRFAVETRLSRRPDLAAQVMGDLSARTGLRLLAQDRVPLPEAMAAQASALLPPAARHRRFAIGAGGGLALLAASFVALLMVRDGPPAYVVDAATSHRVAMIRARMQGQIESPSFDPREILASTHIDIPGLPADWRVTDVQLFPGKRTPALLIALRTPEGRDLSIYAMHRRTDAPERPDSVREGAQSVAYWRRGDMSYALTGEDEPAAIDATAESIAGSWS